MATKSPLATVKDEFGGKDKLVDKIVGLLGSSEEESKDDLRKRLLGAANGKLIRLHRLASELKEAGGRDKLTTSVATELGRAKDKDYVEKLGSYSTGRLLDVLKSARHRNTRQGAAKAAKPAPKAPAAKTKRATKSAKSAETSA